MFTTNLKIALLCALPILFASVQVGAQLNSADSNPKLNSISGTFKSNPTTFGHQDFELVGFTDSKGSQESKISGTSQNTSSNSVSASESRRCGSDEYHALQMADPVFAEEYKTWRKLLKEQIEELYKDGTPPCTTPTIIPVAVHYNSPITDANEQCLIDAAQAQIDQLNLDFSSCNMNAGLYCDWINGGCTDINGDYNITADAMPDAGACIQFCLGDQNLPAGEDNIGGLAITVGDYTWPSVPGSTWDGYLNIFVSDGATAGVGGGVLGVAPLAGGANPNGNGVYVVHTAFGSQSFGGCASGGSLDSGAPYNGGATLTHEIGHYFGLDHTWTDGEADTPPQGGPNFGCPTIDPTTCTCTGNCDAYTGNFMDYVDDDCMFMFTTDQVATMCNVITQSDYNTNAVSCFDDWQNGTNTYNACNGACVICLVTNATSTVVCNGDNAEITICFDVAGGSGSYNLIDNDNGGAVIASIVGGATDGTQICFPLQTIVGPTTATSLNWAVTDINEDPPCEETLTVLVPACPAPMECATSMNSLVPALLCVGESFDVVLTDFTSGDGSVDVDDADGDMDPTTGTDIMDDFLIVYDFDPTTPETAAEIYDDLTGAVDDPDLSFFGEIGLVSDGFAGLMGLDGFANDSCDPLAIDIYVVPVYGEEGFIEPTCPVEGPLNLMIAPDPAAGITLDVTNCVYTITTVCTASQISITGGATAGATITGDGTTSITYAPAEGDAMTTLDISIVNGEVGGDGLPCERAFTLDVDAYETAVITGCPTEAICLDENPVAFDLSATPECVETATATFLVQLVVDFFCDEVSFTLTDAGGNTVIDDNGLPVTLDPCAANGDYLPYGMTDNPVAFPVTVTLPPAAAGTYTLGAPSGTTFNWTAGDTYGDGWIDTAAGGGVDGGYTIDSGDGMTNYAMNFGAFGTDMGSFDPVITNVVTCSSTWTIATDNTDPTDPVGDGVDTANFDPNTIGAGTHDVTYTYTDNNGCTSTTTCTITVIASCATCPDLTVIAPPATITAESMCSTGCVLGGGVIAPPATACPVGSTLQYSTDNATWSTTLPTYDQTNPVTIYTRCLCDGASDPPATDEVSPVNQVTTSPGNACVDPVSPVLTINDNVCPSILGTISAAGGGGVLTYYSNVDAATTMADATAGIGGLAAPPAYAGFPTITYVCVTETDANGCVSAPVCGQTAPVDCPGCDLTNVTVGAPICGSDLSSFTVDVSWTDGPDASISIADAGATSSSGNDPAVDANGTITFVYANNSSWNIVVTDTQGLCGFGPFTGGPFECSCDASNGTLSIKGVQGN